MKQQSNCSEEEISNIEFQKTIVRMINKLKEETQKLVSDLKEDMNKQVKELKENSNKQRNEIKKIMQDMSEEHSKDIEILKKNQSEMNSSIFQIKISIKTLVSRVEQVENRVSGTKGKVEELDQIVKEHEKILRKYEWDMQDIWDTMKRPDLLTMGIEEGEEIQTKGIDNLSNKMTAENFPNLEKERNIQV
jgi:uncharacterized coiled-coil protein SlyX